MKNQLNCKWKGLIEVLLDRNAEFGDRDDAAMALAASDEEEVLNALDFILNDPVSDPDLVEQCQESIWDIIRRRESSKV